LQNLTVNFGFTEKYASELLKQPCLLKQDTIMKLAVKYKNCPTRTYQQHENKINFYAHSDEDEESEQISSEL